jgi:hypothetical protein
MRSRRASESSEGSLMVKDGAGVWILPEGRCGTRSRPCAGDRDDPGPLLQDTPDPRGASVPCVPRPSTETEDVALPGQARRLGLLIHRAYESLAKKRTKLRRSRAGPPRPQGRSRVGTKGYVGWRRARALELFTLHDQLSTFGFTRACARRKPRCHQAIPRCGAIGCISPSGRNGSWNQS